MLLSLNFNTMPFKEIRKELGVSNEEILSFLERKSSIIYHIENNYQRKSIIQYLVFLRAKGIDLNELFDKITEVNFKEKVKVIK